MKGDFKIFLLITAVFLFGFSVITFAESSTSTIQINAEILSNIWYSTTTVNEDDIINIYAGFQNHSTKNLSGTAGFFVDDIQYNNQKFFDEYKKVIFDNLDNDEIEELNGQIDSLLDRIGGFEGHDICETVHLLQVYYLYLNQFSNIKFICNELNKLVQ